MWVIEVSKDLSESRDSVISSLLNQDDRNFKGMYIYLSNRQYFETPNINKSSVWKTKSGAQRIINLYKKGNDDLKINSYRYRVKFPYLLNRYMKVRELTKDEYNSIIDMELLNFDNSYKIKRGRIESKKIKF